MITHKLHLNTYSDQVVILQKSGEALINTHAHFLEHNPQYQNLWELQNQEN